MAGVPYQVYPTATKPSLSRLDPAPVFAANGDALHLYFEIASEDAVEASFTEKKRADNKELVVAAMKKAGKTREQLKDSGSLCPGITLMVSSRKYSLECFYGLKRIEVTTATTKNGLDNRCRGCHAPALEHQKETTSIKLRNVKRLISLGRLSDAIKMLQSNGW